jgi:hypothetical protein
MSLGKSDLGFRLLKGDMFHRLETDGRWKTGCNGLSTHQERNSKLQEFASLRLADDDSRGVQQYRALQALVGVHNPSIYPTAPHIWEPTFDSFVLDSTKA